MISNNKVKILEKYFSILDKVKRQGPTSKHIKIIIKNLENAENQARSSWVRNIDTTLVLPQS